MATRVRIEPAQWFTKPTIGNARTVLVDGQRVGVLTGADPTGTPRPVSYLYRPDNPAHPPVPFASFADAAAAIGGMYPAVTP